MFTDVILAVLAYTAPRASFSVKEVFDFYNFLLEMMPVYIPTNLSEAAIQDTAEEYPNIFTLREGEGTILLSRGDSMPNLDHFLLYSEDMKRCILSLARMWAIDNNKLESKGDLASI